MLKTLDDLKKIILGYCSWTPVKIPQSAIWGLTRLSASIQFELHFPRPYILYLDCLLHSCPYSLSLFKPCVCEHSFRSLLCPGYISERYFPCVVLLMFDCFGLPCTILCCLSALVFASIVVCCLPWSSACYNHVYCSALDIVVCPPWYFDPRLSVLWTCFVLINHTWISQSRHYNYTAHSP